MKIRLGLHYDGTHNTFSQHTEESSGTHKDYRDRERELGRAGRWLDSGQRERDDGDGRSPSLHMPGRATIRSLPFQAFSLPSIPHH